MSTRGRRWGNYDRQPAPPPRPSAAEERYRAAVGAAKARLDLVIASGDDTTAAMARFDREVDEALNQRLLNIKGGDMPGKSSFKDIITTYADRAMAAASAIQELDARKDEMVLLAYQREHARLAQEVRQADFTARRAMDDYVRESYEHADDLRSRYDADRDPATRTAEIMEQSALMASDVSAEKLLDDATKAVNAKRPERAVMLLSVAAGKKPDAGSLSRLATLQVAVTASLNELIPELAQAAAVEAEVIDNATTFEQARYATLARSGFGVAEDGGVGSGGPGEIASASSRLKLVAKAKAERDGVAYVEPDAALPGLPTGVAVNSAGSLPEPMTPEQKRVTLPQH